MDWQSLYLSFQLAIATVLGLMPIAIGLGWWLGQTHFRGKIIIEALIVLPLVLPPTVLGFYMLQGFGAGSVIGSLWAQLFDGTLVFSFEGLLLASIVVNLPFAVLPVQRSFSAIPAELREAASCCGMSPFQRLRRVELPLAWPGLLTGMVLTFAHTLGEFGVVLMVGGAIPGETRTIAIAIYDSVQSFDDRGAAVMSAVLLAISLATVLLTFAMSKRVGRWLG